MENRILTEEFKKELEIEGINSDAVHKAMQSVLDFIKDRLTNKVDTSKMDVVNHIMSLPLNEKEKMLVAMFAEESINKVMKISKAFSSLLEGI